jgi:hypothetical protein
MATRASRSRSRVRRVRALAGSVESARVEAFGRPQAEAAVDRTVRVVAEGDSWFSYVPPTDVLACLRKRLWDGWKYDVADRAKAGATLNDMVYGRDIIDTYQLIEQHRPEVILFSGGGNDIAGGELYVLLYNKKAIEPNAGIPHVNRNILKGLVDEVFSTAFRDLLGLLRFKLRQVGTPNVPILFHGYAYAIPDGRGWLGGWGPLPGPWLDPGLTRKGYHRKNDATVRTAIVKELIDAFNEMLEAVVARDPHAHYVNLRGTLTNSQWDNELHPTTAGFLAVTRKIERKLRTVVSGA